MLKTSRPTAVVIFAALTLFVAGCSRFGFKQELKWHLVLEVIPTGSSLDDAATQTKAVLERRLESIGIRDFLVTVQPGPAKGRIEVSLPIVSDPDRVKKLLISSSKLEIAHVRSPPSPAPVASYETKEAAAEMGKPTPNLRILRYLSSDESAVDPKRPVRWVIIEGPPIIDNQHLRIAQAVPSEGLQQNDYAVAFTLKPAGAQRMSEWTKNHINQYLGVILDDEVQSIAYVKSEISDTGQIQGRFTRQTAEDLAQVLNSGALPAGLRLIDERTD